MRPRPSMISSLFDANEGPSKLVLLPFRPLLGDLAVSWTTELKCSSRRPRRPNSATSFRPLSGFGAFEIDGDAENRSEGFRSLAASLPLGTKLQNSVQWKLGSKNRLSVP